MRLGPLLLAVGLAGCAAAESPVDSKGSVSADAADAADAAGPDGATPDAAGDTSGGADAQDAALDAVDAAADTGQDADTGAGSEVVEDAALADGTADDADAETPDSGGADAQSDVAGPDAGAAPPPTIADFVDAIEAQDNGALDALLAAWDMPICDGSQCLFVTVQPGAQSVLVLGDFNGWQGGAPLAPVSFAPTVFWGLVDMAVGGVTEYKLQVDGEWALDGSNRYFRFGPFGPNSAIYGPGMGRLTALSGVASTELGNQRDLYVYLPAPYFEAPDARFPVLYMQDGFNVFTNPAAPFGSWNVEVTADALIAQGLLAPVIIVGVDTSARLDEYTYAPIPLGEGASNPKLPLYGAFLTGTVKPLVDATFRTLQDRASTGIAGSSLGGISSLWLAFAHAETFGFVASFSGSYWIGESNGAEQATPMRELLAAMTGPSPSTLRIYLDSGDSTFDGQVSYEADAWVYSDWTRNALVALGWDDRPAWDTDGDLGTPPADLPASTPPASVPSLAWASAPPPNTSWGAWLGTDRNLLSMVGHGHAHNEAAWEARFGAALVFLAPGPAVKN
jgi:predicted alpha/beta superfamily hydrolase